MGRSNSSIFSTGHLQHIWYTYPDNHVEKIISQERNNYGRVATIQSARQAPTGHLHG
ncbi:hypothetical protein EZMO1_3824 [Endozoicomonas montiporae CL-33]|uniref:Uncharacterized protein n=1 Tax=Endozoicomonas montiporae CL-33 TaxID=570277 RepID=A0A142BG91_9GAMM|nr:hypothetical protein EZMO1_3824 [Endozoicomonas montiporae CL-33]